MKKLYKCKRPATNILVTIDGKVRSLEFNPDVIETWGLRGCSFVTDDKVVQEAIEKHPYFATKGLDRIWTDDIEKVNEPTKADEQIKELNKEEQPNIVRRYKAKKEE